MAGSKARRLGSGFEYEIRDVFREATGDDGFERVPTSGSFVGGSNAKKAENLREDATEIMAGDLIVPKGWRWSVECKNHVDTPFHRLFMGDRCSQIDEFIEQVMGSANLAKREPLLVMKWRKSPAKFSKKIKETILESGQKLPQTKTTTMGILIGELAEHCEDLSHLNHIVYTSVSENNVVSTWRFFDLDKWIEYITDRHYKD